MIIPVELEEVRLIEAKPVSNLGKRGLWLRVLAEQIEKDTIWEKFQIYLAFGDWLNEGDKWERGKSTRWVRGPQTGFGMTLIQIHPYQMHLNNMLIKSTFEAHFYWIISSR